jgi:pilus assembly protein CpaF
MLVRQHEGDVWVTDQSSNGTFIGSERISGAEARLPPGSPIRIGHFVLKVTRLEPEHGRHDVLLRRRIHRQLLEHLKLDDCDVREFGNPEFRARVTGALERLVSAAEVSVSARDGFIGEMLNEVLGLGPLETLINDREVSEVMVVDPSTIYVERNGRIEMTSQRFIDDESCRAVIERIVTPLGRRIDESAPVVDARLADGSRVNAIIPPLALRGPCITIRKFARTPLTMDDLVASGSLNRAMAQFLSRSVKARKNILISGGTGSGKTTLLNVLSASIPPGERIVTIEDAAELQLDQPHVVSLESKPANLEGRGGYSIRDLVKNALRMRPDRIVVGECRAGEAIDMLQAMNTGHEGSMTTTHANSVTEALKRIETLCLMSDLELPVRAIRNQIGASVDLIVQQARFSDGSRRVTCIAEVVGLSSQDEILLQDIFFFRRTGTSQDGTVLGEHAATGRLPTFLDAFDRLGLIIEGGDYL